MTYRYKKSETTNNTTDTITKFSTKYDPNNCSTYVDILFPRTYFLLFKENLSLDDPT